MTASLTKADGSYTSVGTLANYSLSHSAVPVDPKDTGGQIPTFNALIADITGDPKTLIDTDVALEDWTGSVSTGRVVSVSTNNNGKAAIDSSTIFERLNTTQTTLPIIYSELASVDPVRDALTHWMLMAGITPEILQGKVLQYIPSGVSGSNTFGYIADSISKYRFFGPPDSYVKFVPSAATHANPIEVNPAQSVIVGGAFTLANTLSEFRILTNNTRDTGAVIYTLRRNGSTWTLREKVGSAAEVVLLTKTWSPANTNNTFYAFAQIKANAVADKVDITLRLMESQDVTLNTVYSDTTVTGVTSSLRLRPKPYAVEIGYNSTLTAGHTNYDGPDAYFMLESPNLPTVFPELAYNITTSEDSLSESFKARMPFKIPGFTANVWEKIREFCALLELDISFERGKIVISMRSSKRETLYDHNFIPALDIAKSNIAENANNRDTARSVEVVYRELVGDENKFSSALLWKADSVYSLEKGETREEVIQTNSSYVFLHQPIAVGGVPVPYTSSYSSYVITGNDGYIVDPNWWVDNGGSIRVEQTGISGEIKLVMQAPTVDSVRAPYRISEGVADRPALYVLGYGMQLSEPKVVKVYTGAGDAAQDVGTKYDSIFCTKKLMAFNAGHKLAVSFGSAESKIQFVVSQADQLAPVSSSDPLTPLADSVYWKGSYYRIVEESIGHGSISVDSAPRYNTVRVLNGEFATGKTIADWNALHAGKLIRDVNLAPLPNYVS